MPGSSRPGHDHPELAALLESRIDKLDDDVTFVLQLLTL